MKLFGDDAIATLLNKIKAKFNSLAKVATSGSYTDLSNKPTIPSVGNGRITIKQGGITKGTFTVNQSGATGIELDDNDTHYTSKNVVGSSADDTNNTTTALTNGNVFLNSVENGSVTSSHNIKGIGGTTVSTDKSGNIIIKGTTGTYSAGTGLSLSGTTFNHSNSVTAGTAQGDASKTLTFGGTFTVPTVTYDAQGHVTGKGTTTMTMPANPNTDTKNTAGSTDTSSKIFLIGATSQAANPQTYSHDTAYVGTDGCLYSGGTKVSVNGHTHGVATTSSSGFLSSTDKSKLDGIAAGAQVNQKAFSQFKVGTTEIKADTETDILTLVAGSNVTLTPDATNDRITIEAKDTTYSTGTDKTAGITKLYSNIGTSTDGTMTQLAIGDALAGKAGTSHTHTKSQITDFPTSLKNPNGLRVQVNGDGASEIRYDGSVAKTINIKAGSNITITSDSSGNITISSTASAGPVTGDVGTVVYEASSGGLYCDGKTANNSNNSVAIEDSSYKYKRLRFYCKGYYGLVCTDMPLDRECDAYATGNDRGKRYGGVIFPTAENGNINSTGIGPSNHMYYELKWRVEKETAGWRVRVVDSGWLGFNAGITSNANYTGNSSAAVAGTNYISWNQRHNDRNAYGIYKIVAYTN